MDIGKLNKIVTFKQNVPITKGAGKEDVYTTLLTTRGSMVQKGSGRGLGYGEITNGKTWELVVRWEEDLDNLDYMKMKVVYDNKTYQITSSEKIGEKRFYMKFGLSEDGSGLTGAVAAENWLSFTYNQTTGLLTFDGTAGDYLTQIDLRMPDDSQSYVNDFNEAFSVSAFSGATVYLRYFTPGDVLIKWRRVTAGSFTPVTDWAEDTLTVTRLSQRYFTLYDSSNALFASSLFPGTPLNIAGTALGEVTDMDEYITEMNADATNAAKIVCESYVETSRIDVLVSPVSPYQDYGSWNRILKVQRT